MAKNKSDKDVKEIETKTKPKKTKKVDVEKDIIVDEKIEDVKVVEDNVKVDVEIDLRSYNHSDVVGGYIRRKRSI